MNIYLDNTSTKEILPECINAVQEIMINNWHNPSGLTQESKNAKKILYDCRMIIAKHINADPSEIIFTSSGCESNSLALTGFLKAYSGYYLVIDQNSHASVINNPDTSNCLRVDNHGAIKEDEMIKFAELSNNLFSINGVNNETGTINNIKHLTYIAHNYGINNFIHIDGVQILGKLKIDVKDLDVDMMSFSGHKIGAPSGIGFLYVRKGIKLNPIIYGSQEDGLRGGTENLPYIVALAEAIKSININDNNNLKSTRQKFIDMLQSINECEVKINQSEKQMDSILSVTFIGIDAQSLLLYLDTQDIKCNTGSACNSFQYKPSHVLLNNGLSEKDALSTIRFTIDEMTDEEMIKVCKAIKDFCNITNLKEGWWRY